MNEIDLIYKNNKKNSKLKAVSEAFNPLLKTEVLVFCYAYNHEKYIRRCINGMLSQLVDFNVKIIIHNDNSTDSTKTIIESYAKMFPNIISVINQQTNLYSKETALLPIFQYLRQFHTGNYIAICEGDDYWIDNLKLKTQVEMFNKNVNCHFCVHKVNVIDSQKKEFIRTIPAKKFNVKSGIIGSKQFISLAMKKYPFQTSSYMFRTLDFSNYLDNLPLFAKTMPTEDESVLLYFGQLGDTCYISHPFSNYMKFSDGSWSNSNKNEDVQKRIMRLHKMIEAIEEFDSYTLNKYSDDCKKRIIKHQFGILRLENRVEDAFNNRELRAFFKHKYPKDYYSLILKNFFCKKSRKKNNGKKD